jgi:hypothetical protein
LQHGVTPAVPTETPEQSSVVIGQAQALPSELPSQDAILFDQIRQCFALLTIQSADQDREPHLESRYVDHGRRVYFTKRKIGLSQAVDRVVGQFGVFWPDAILADHRKLAAVSL